MRIIGLAAALVAGSMAFYDSAWAAQPEVFDMRGYVDMVVDFVQHNQAWALPIIFLLSFGESIAFVSLVLPFWAALVALGALFTNNSGTNADVAFIWAAASVGAALGDWFSYWLGYHYHSSIKNMWPFSRNPEVLEKGHAFFEKWGVWAIWLGRFSGPLRASVPIIAGALQMNRTKFQIANWLSAGLWAAVLLTFGDFIGKALEYISKLF